LVNPPPGAGCHAHGLFRDKNRRWKRAPGRSKRRGKPHNIVSGVGIIDVDSLPFHGKGVKTDLSDTGCSSLEAIILAGGLGTRLRPVVSDVPKPMAPVLGRPFLAYLLDHMVGQGVRRVVLSTGYLGAEISNYFGAGYRGLELVYECEEKPLGTGGALVRSFERLEGDAAMVLNGDTLFALDYAALMAVHKAAGAEVTIALRRTPDCSRYGGVVVCGEHIVRFRAAGEPAPGLISGGIYVIARELLHRYPLPARFSLEKDLIEAHVAELKPGAFISDAPFLDIGVPEAYGEAAGFLGHLRGA